MISSLWSLQYRRGHGHYLDNHIDNYKTAPGISTMKEKCEVA